MDDDRVLIERAIAADKEAFGQLVDRYKNRIVRAAFRFSGNFKDAEDIAQEAFIKAYMNLRRFKRKSNFSTWLYRITYNTAINYIRGRQEGHLSYDEFNEEDMHLNNPEDEMIKKEKEEVIQRAVDKLPLKLRSVIIFREYEGLSYKQISEVLGCSMGTVESRIARARERLKVLLRPYILQGEKS